MGCSVVELISVPTNWTYVSAATSKTSRAADTWYSLDTF